jgi:hypothetical protein
MAGHIVVARTTNLKEDDVAGECHAGSPGSDGASPYPELRPACAGTSPRQAAAPVSGQHPISRTARRITAAANFPKEALAE